MTHGFGVHESTLIKLSRKSRCRARGRKVLRNRYLALALVVALISSLVSTAVEAQVAVGIPVGGNCNNGGITVGFGGVGESYTTNTKGTGWFGLTTYYKGKVANNWTNDGSSGTVRVPVGLWQASNTIWVSAWAENLKVLGVWVSMKAPLGKVVPDDITMLKPSKWDCNKGAAFCYEPTACDGDRVYVYAQFEGSQRDVHKLPLLGVDLIFKNAGTFVKHKSPLQLIGTIPVQLFEFKGKAPLDAADLGAYLIGPIGSGGFSPQAATIIARAAHDSAMSQPVPPGGFTLSFTCSDGTPYVGMVKLRYQHKKTGKIWTSSRKFRAPDIGMGPTTPGTYIFTCVLDDGSYVTQEAVVSSDAVIPITVPV